MSGSAQISPAPTTLIWAESTSSGLTGSLLETIISAEYSPPNIPLASKIISTSDDEPADTVPDSGDICIASYFLVLVYENPPPWPLSVQL